MRISDATSCPGNSTGASPHLSNEMPLNTYVKFQKNHLILNINLNELFQSPLIYHLKELPFFNTVHPSSTNNKININFNL
jgi:hypothetical protein